MPSYVQARRVGAGDVLKVGSRADLAGHFLHERQVEIFFPACKRVVGTAKSRVRRSVGEEERAGGELLFEMAGDFVHVIAYAQVHKSRGCKQCGEELVAAHALEPYAAE